MVGHLRARLKGYHSRMNPAWRSLRLPLASSLGLHLLLLTGLPSLPEAPPQRPRTLQATLMTPSSPAPKLELEQEIRTPVRPQPKRQPAPPPPTPRKPLLSRTPQPAKLPPAVPRATPGAPTPPPAPLAREAQKQLARMASREDFYPTEAILKGWQGEVLVQIFLDARGNVIAARIEKRSAYPLLDQAALKAVRALRSLPASGLEETVLPVRFRLE